MTFRGICTMTELLLGLISLPVLKGEPQLIGSPNPVVGLEGHYCILPCSLQPAESVIGKTVEWTRSNLNPSYVHILRGGSLLYDDVNPSFLQRTNLFEQELKNGNMALRLSDLKISDSGTYTCKLITSSETSVQVSLIVGAVSDPQIFPERFIDKLVYRCEAKNWHPEPEMEWRDSEGQMIPHDNIYTERDEYYSVYSRIKVDIAASKNYTCIVRQSDIGEVRVANFTTLEIYGEVASLKILTLHLRGWLIVAGLLIFGALILVAMRLIYGKRIMFGMTEAAPAPGDATDGIPLAPVNENLSIEEQLELLRRQNEALTAENGRLREENERLSRCWICW